MGDAEALELQSEIDEAAALAVDTVVSAEGITLDETNRLCIEIGVNAGMAAALTVLARKGMITAPGEGITL